MAQYTVTHSCGHAEAIHLYGKSSERENRITRLQAYGLCSECFAAARRQRQERASIESEKWAADNGLPTLQGSEKQCSWAEAIRREQLTRLIQMASRGDDGLHFWLETIGRSKLPDLPETAEPFVATIKESPLTALSWSVFADWLDEQGQTKAADRCRAVGWLVEQSEAKWWIDGRYRTTDETLRERIQEPERLAKEESERQARIAEVAAKKEAEAEKVRKEWEYKDAIAKRARAAVREPGGNFTISVWSDGNNTERRVYFDEGKGHARNGWKVCVYHTGSSKKRPGTIEGFTAGALSETEQVTLLELAADLCKQWKCWSHYVGPVKTEG